MELPSTPYSVVLDPINNIDELWIEHDNRYYPFYFEPGKDDAEAVGLMRQHVIDEPAGWGFEFELPASAVPYYLTEEVTEDE